MMYTFSDAVYPSLYAHSAAVAATTMIEAVQSLFRKAALHTEQQ